MIKRSQLWTLIRLALSIALLWLALRPIEWETLQDAHNQLSISWLVLALLVMVTTNILAAIRWGWIARSGGLKLSWRRFIALYFAGGLINQGLPSTLGGDTYRAILSARDQHISDHPALRYGVLYVALDRGIGLLTNVLIGATGLILAGVFLIPWAPRIGWFILGLIGIGFIIVSVLMALEPHTRLVDRILNRLRLPGALAAIRTTIAIPASLGQLLLGILIHLLTLYGFLLCLKAYGVEVPFEAIMIGIPALTILMILPISISGWGLRESTLSAVLAIWSVPASATVLASISFGLIIVVCYLPAGWFLIRNRVISKPTTT